MNRPKLRWEDRLKTDLKELLLFEDMTSDRNAWRARIREFHAYKFLVFPVLRLFVPCFFPLSISFFPLVGALALCLHCVLGYALQLLSLSVVSPFPPICALLFCSFVPVALFFLRFRLLFCFLACFSAPFSVCAFVNACLYGPWFLCLFAVDLCIRFRFSLLWYIVMHCLLPEVFLEAVPLPSGRGVTLYIPPPPYLVSAGLGNVVVN
ncbi:hypothetical protein Tco_0792295 [Tanacetum coccineum]